MERKKVCNHCRFHLREDSPVNQSPLCKEVTTAPIFRVEEFSAISCVNFTLKTSNQYQRNITGNSTVSWLHCWSLQCHKFVSLRINCFFNWIHCGAWCSAWMFQTRRTITRLLYLQLLFQLRHRSTTLERRQTKRVNISWPLKRQMDRGTEGWMHRLLQESKSYFVRQKCNSRSGMHEHSCRDTAWQLFQLSASGGQMWDGQAWGTWALHTPSAFPHSHTKQQ